MSNIFILTWESFALKDSQGENESIPLRTYSLIFIWKQLHTDSEQAGKQSIFHLSGSS